MKIWVTNESSSFARSFAKWCSVTGKHTFVNSLDSDEYSYFRQENLFRAKEVDIFDPTLPTMLSRSGAEIIIHQLPITPEKSTKHADYALRNNIEGSYYVIEAAKEAGIPIFFITSKNYDYISNKPATDIYDITAVAVDGILDVLKAEHVTIVPPVIYGPDFDEGISGLIKSTLTGKSIDLTINPEGFHPFMYVDDFFDALDLTITNLFDPEYDIITHSVVYIAPQLGECNTFDDVLSLIENDSTNVNYTVNSKVDGYSYNTKNNISTLYGWKAKFNLKDGIKDLLAKVKENDVQGKK